MATVLMAGPQVRAYPFGLTEELQMHPTYGWVREHDPLCRVRMPYGDEAWLVTRYEDTKLVLGDPRFCRAAGPHDEPRLTPEIIPMGLLDMDPPDHTRYRRLVSKEFTARRVELLRPRVEQIAADLLDSMVAAGPSADLVQSIGLPLTMTVICELLGVPYTDREKFEAWTANVMSTMAVTETLRSECFTNLIDYMSGLVDRRLQNPTDDLLGALASAGERDDRLSHGDLVFLGLTLLGAGYETTANQTCNFVYVMLTHPDQLALLREDAGLIPGAVEELLRFIPLGTASVVPRYATTDVELSGGTVPAGDPVFVFHPAADRDPRAFVDPERLDVTRRDNAHVAFGHGMHHCLGAPLARLELQVVLRGLLDRLPGLHLAVDPDEVEWKVGRLVRGPVALPVGW
jgi:cytochrome P450